MVKHELEIMQNAPMNKELSNEIVDYSTISCYIIIC